MAVQHMCEVACGDCDVGDADGCESFHVVVYDRLAVYLQQRLWRCEGQWPESLAFSSGHQDGRNGQACGCAGHVDHGADCAVAVQDGYEHVASTPES